MKILLTGGLGFTGVYLRQEAADRGYEVVLLRSDITDSRGLKQELSNLEIDAVIHLAALSHVALSGALDYYRVNVLGTCQLLAAIMQIRRPPDRVLIQAAQMCTVRSRGRPFRNRLHLRQSMTMARVNWRWNF